MSGAFFLDIAIPRMPIEKVSPTSDARRYWRINLWVLSIMLTIWFTVSILLSIVWADALNQYRLGGFPLGFWMSQQGSTLVFVVLIFAYAIIMGRMDKNYNQSQTRS